MQVQNTNFFLPTWLLLFLFLFPTAKPDLSSEKLALLTLRSSVRGRTILRWNSTDRSPCSWDGVECESNHVTVLRLPGFSLAGEIPTGVFSNLTNLRTLSLRLNALTGPLPSDLAACTNLRNLYLQGNGFASRVPDFVFEFHGLVHLNLASNNFSGKILGFNNLTRLRTLFLENNKLSGSIPYFKLPNLEKFNVSNNLLHGSVPISLKSFPKSAFLGNSLCGRPLEGCFANGSKPLTVNIDHNVNNGKKKLPGRAIAGIVIGSVLGFILITVILMLLCYKKSSNDTRSIDNATSKLPEIEVPLEKPVEEVENGSYENNGYSAEEGPAVTGNGKKEGNASGGVGAKRLVFFGNFSERAVFELEDLLRASAEVLGKGTFGTSYKAVLEVGTVVAVKRLRDVTISEREFREKIEVVGAMEHENLVPLTAYYYSAEEKLLVYDYMPAGSLSALLHGDRGAGRTPLNWEIRSAITLGAARAIKYLHSQGISHGNIKSSNILLTKSYDPLVSDFGLAYLVGVSSTPNRVAGYRAPEVTDPRKVSQKADVYSFGTLLLELLTGKAPSHAILDEEGVDLPRWVQSVVREEWTSEVFDLELLKYQNVDEMVQLLQLAIDCVAQYPDKRPTIYEVTSRIEESCGSSSQEDHDSRAAIVRNSD